MNYSEALRIVSKGNDPFINGNDCKKFRYIEKPFCQDCFIKKLCHEIKIRQDIIEQLTILARKEKLEKLLEK